MVNYSNYDVLSRKANQAKIRVGPEINKPHVRCRLHSKHEKGRQP